MALVTISDPRSPASEAYRSLRTNLSFYSLDAPLRTLSEAVAEHEVRAVRRSQTTERTGGPIPTGRFFHEVAGQRDDVGLQRVRQLDKVFIDPPIEFAGQMQVGKIRDAQACQRRGKSRYA